jgi:hypothetical protein
VAIVQGGDITADGGTVQVTDSTLPPLHMVEARNNGVVHLIFGQGQPQAITNVGTIEATSGGLIQLASSGSGGSFTGTVINDGQINAAGGTIAIAAQVTQSASGVMTISANGTLTLAGKTDGGTIIIQSGMLNFAPTQFAPGPYAASTLSTPVAFTGTSGSLNFGQPISEVYRAAQNDLLVTAPGKGGAVAVADIHLLGAYTAADFSVQGTQILYTAHPGP